MDPKEFEVGIPVMHGLYQHDGSFFPSTIDGIAMSMRREIHTENGKKYYTIELGKRKPYYPKIKIVNWYVTVMTTDGDMVEINTENLCIMRNHERNKNK